MIIDQDEENEEITSPSSTLNTRPGGLSFVKMPSVVNDEMQYNVEQIPTEDEIDVAVEEEVVLHIVRPPGTGLGISIAGGAGSTPYRENDEVEDS